MSKVRIVFSFSTPIQCSLGCIFLQIFGCSTRINFHILLQECRQVDIHPIPAMVVTHHPHTADPMATLAIIHPLPILHPKDGLVHLVTEAHPPMGVRLQETTDKATMAHDLGTHHPQDHLRVHPLLRLQLRLVVHLQEQHLRVHPLDLLLVHPVNHLMDPLRDPIMISIK